MKRVWLTPLRNLGIPVIPVKVPYVVQPDRSGEVYTIDPFARTYHFDMYVH